MVEGSPAWKRIAGLAGGRSLLETGPSVRLSVWMRSRSSTVVIPVRLAARLVTLCYLANTLYSAELGVGRFGLLCRLNTLYGVL